MCVRLPTTHGPQGALPHQAPESTDPSVNLICTRERRSMWRDVTSIILSYALMKSTPSAVLVEYLEKQALVIRAELKTHHLLLLFWAYGNLLTSTLSSTRGPRTNLLQPRSCLQSCRHNLLQANQTKTSRRHPLVCATSPLSQMPRFSKLKTSF
jgi:hypothetical protein